MNCTAKTNVLLIGGGGHCRSVIEAMSGTRWQPAGILDKDPLLHGEMINDIPVLGSDEELENLRNNFEYALVTVGQTRSYEPRGRLFNKLKQLGYKAPIIIAKSAIVSPSSIIGAGTVILNYAFVNASVRVGENCILNTRALVEHDAIIGNNCHISTGAIVNGGAKIGDNVFVGTGSLIREGVNIGANTLIGMGAIVRKDVPSGVVFHNKGSASVIRKNPYIKGLE